MICSIMAPPTSGLAFASKPPPSLQSRLAGQKRKKTLFDDRDSDAEDGSETQSISTLGGLSKSQSSARRPSKSPKLNGKPPAAEKDPYANLSALHTSKKHDKEAQDLDPSIYDYDTFYDVTKAPEREKQPADGPRESRYINTLLKSKDIRERDRLRAEEKKLAREREAEGDEFNDKEKFVTRAYKRQQEERRKADELEAQREKEEEARRKKGEGMRGLYQNVLEKEEHRREAIRKAEEDILRKKERGETVEDAVQGEKEKTDAELARELNEKGANVTVNDEGVVVDKRQLLTAGLNVARKPKPTTSDSTAANKSAPRPSTNARDTGPSSARRSQIDRQTAMMEEQLLAKHQEAEEAVERERREMEEKARSKKSGEEVIGAKERYLARKREREREAEEAKGKGAGK